MSLLKKGASHGYAPRSLVCCVCNCPLTKNSVSSGIRIFNCGHAIHLQCEVSEIEGSSKTSSSGCPVCPVCMPNQKSQQSRNKSIIAANGLVNKFSSRPQYPHGSSIHPHDSDLSDNMYGQQQISRVNINKPLYHLFYLILIKAPIPPCFQDIYIKSCFCSSRS